MKKQDIDQFTELKNRLRAAAQESCLVSNKLCDTIARSNGALRKALIGEGQKHAFPAKH